MFGETLFSAVASPRAIPVVARIRLRLVTGPQSGRVISLSARRCTLGSAPGCTLRLRAAGIEPIHCVIDRTGDRTLIRSITGRTWLNGEPLAETELFSGSCLRLGGIEFVVEDDGRPARANEAAAPILDSEVEPMSAPPAIDQTGELRRALQSRLEEIDRSLDQLGRDLGEQHAALQAELSQAAPALAGQIAETVVPTVVSRVSYETRSWLNEELAALSKEITSQATTQVWSDVAAKIDLELTSRVAPEVARQTEVAMGQSAGEITSALTSLLEAVVPERVAGEVQRQICALEQTVVGNVRTDVQQWLDGQLPAVTAQVTAQVVPQVCHELRPRLTEEVTEQVGSSLRAEITAELAARLPQETERAAQDAVATAAARLTDELSLELNSRLEVRLADELARQAAPLREAVGGDVETNLRHWLNAELPVVVEHLAAQLVPQVTNVVTPQITDDLNARLNHSVAVQVNEQLLQRLPAEVSQAAAASAGQLAARLNDDLSAKVSEEIGRQSSDWLAAATSQAAIAAGEQAAAQVAPAITEQVTQTLSDRLSTQIREQLGTVVAPDVSRQIEGLSQRLTDDVRTQITDEIGRQSGQWRSDLADSLLAETTERAAEQIMQRVEERLASQAQDASEKALPRGWLEQLSQEMASQVDGLSAQLAREVTDRVRNQLADQIDTQVSRQLASEQAALEAQRAVWDQQQQKSQGELNLHAQHLEQRLEALTRFQRGLDEQHQQWQHDLQALRPEVQAHGEQLQHQAAQWRKVLEDYTAEREAWRAELRRWQEENSVQSQQLAERIESLAVNWGTFEQEQRSRLADAESTAAVHTEQIDHRLAEIRAEREAFEQDRHHGEARNLLHPGEHARDLDERLAELNEARQAVQRERQHVWQDEPESRSTNSPSNERPNEPVADADGQLEEKDSLQDVMDGSAQLPSREVDETETALPAGRSYPGVDLAKMFPHLLREDDQHEEEEQPVGATREDLSSHTKTSLQPSSDDDESIEHYMARLMDRVRTVQGGNDSGLSAAPADANTPRRREMPAEPAAPAPVPEPELPKVKDLSELVPRGTPAELTSNISAMRDLANMTARSAIDTHSRKRMRTKVWGKLFVAFVALLAAAALTWMSSTAGQIAYGAALVSTIVAAIWGLEYLILSGYHFWWRKDPSAADAGTVPDSGEKTS